MPHSVIPTGDCPAGSIIVQTSDIVVPEGCSFTVIATMENRPGCTSSGADAGDNIKVDIPAGPKPNIIGASNASITDSYTLVGPGTIRITSRSNRQDEITTYTVTSVGVDGLTCPNCISNLPVELVSFNTEVENRAVKIKWITNVELNNDYFVIEKSKDGIHFEEFYFVNGIGNSNTQSIYELLDINPFQNISYYRLKQFDLNGDTKVLGIRAVNLNTNSNFSVFPNPASSEIFILDDDLQHSYIELINNLGQVVVYSTSNSKTILNLDVNNLPKGSYILKLTNSSSTKTSKVILN